MSLEWYKSISSPICGLNSRICYPKKLLMQNWPPQKWELFLKSKIYLSLNQSINPKLLSEQNMFPFNILPWSSSMKYNVPVSLKFMRPRLRCLHHCDSVNHSDVNHMSYIANLDISPPKEACQCHDNTHRLIFAISEHTIKCIEFLSLFSYLSFQFSSSFLIGFKPSKPLLT